MKILYRNFLGKIEKARLCMTKILKMRDLTKYVIRPINFLVIEPSKLLIFDNIPFSLKVCLQVTGLTESCRRNYLKR